MRRIGRLSRTILLAACLATTIGTLGSASGALAGPANPLPETGFTAEPTPAGPAQASTIAYYEEHFHVSFLEAERRIGLQNRTRQLVPALEGSAGSRYAGLWFDNTDGRLKVGVVAGPTSKSTLNLLADRGIGEETDIVSVSSSMAELTAEQAALDRKFHELEDAGLMRTGIDAATNAVVIMLPQEIASGDSQGVRDAIASSPVEIETEVTPGAFAAIAAQTACGIKYNAGVKNNIIECAKPLRGGVEIEGASSACSAGFYAIDNATQHVVFITAGHCFSGGPYWYSNYWDGIQSHQPVRREIGPMTKPYWGVLGDAMEVDAMSNGCGSEVNWWCYSGWPPEYMSTITKLYDNPVNSVNVSQVGYALCETGGFGASKCGTVQHTHVTIHDGAEVQNTTEINICLHEGDSGGPVYSGDVAYGINNATTSGAPCHSWYTEALNVENLLNVTIL